MITQNELIQGIVENKIKMLGLAYSITKNTHDAEDAVGETILVAFNKYISIRKKESIGAWLMSIVHNEAYSILRRRSRIELSPNIIEFAKHTDDVDSNIENTHMWEQIFKLPDDYRSLIYLYYIDDYSVKEISKILNIAEGTVKSRLSRSRELLRELLGKEELTI